jgi:hypothetical protein
MGQTTMRVTAGLSVALLATAVMGLQAADAKDWVPVTTPDGAFRFEAPVAPVAESKTGSAGNHSYTLTTYTATDGGFVLVALAERFDTPTIAIKPNSVAERLMANLKQTIAVNESRPYRRGPHDVVPGVFLAGKSDAQACQVRAAADGSEAFVLMACSTGAASDAADISKAIASFTLVKPHSPATWLPVTHGLGALHFQAPPQPEVTTKNNAGVPQTIFFARDGGLFVAATYADAGDTDPVGLDKLTAGYVDGGKYTLMAKTAQPYALGGRVLPGNFLEVENAAMKCKTRLVVDYTKTYALAACVMAGYEIGDLPDQILATFALTAAN